jgi:septal ring factor EnvC (AmiA/AmiB activator)
MAHRIGAPHLALLAVVCAAAAGCVQCPATAAREAQQFNDIGDQLNELRTENAALESVVDSLRTVIAKHDTTMLRIANATGVVVVK